MEMSMCLQRHHSISILHLTRAQRKELILVLLVWVQITETRPAVDRGQVVAAIPHQIAGKQHEGIMEASSASEHHVRRISSTDADHIESGDLYPTTAATETMAEV